MLIEKYKSKHLNYETDDLKVPWDDNEDRLILNEFDDEESAPEEGDFDTDDILDIYDEYEDTVGTSENDNFDSSVFNIGKTDLGVPSQVSNTSEIHSFDELIQFTLDTCERLKLECPQDMNRISNWVLNCHNQYLRPQSVSVENPIDLGKQTDNLIPNSAFRPQPSFQPLQVEMVSYDRDGNAKKVDTGVPGDMSIEDACTVCADDEF